MDAFDSTKPQKAPKNNGLIHVRWIASLLFALSFSGNILAASPAQPLQLGKSSEQRPAQNLEAGKDNFENNYHTNSCNCEQQRNWWEKFTTDPIATFTFFLVIVTGGLIYVGLRQERWIRRVYRPKVRVKHIWLTSDISIDEPINVTLIIVNNGDTPAIIKDVRYITHIVRHEEGLPADLLDRKPTRTLSNVLNAGISLRIENLTDDRTLTAADVVGMRQWREGARARRLYCIGDIEYFDEYGKCMKTAFCRRWEFPNYPVTTASTRGRFKVVADDTDYEYQD